MPRVYLYSASRLRNTIEDWKQITPQPLQKAVEAVHRNFEEQAWRIREIMTQGCHPALHKGLTEQARKISRLMEQQLGCPALPTVDDEGQTEPAVFSSYFHRCAALLAGALRRIFSDLLDISLAQSTVIDRPPVDWAAIQAKVLVADESYGISLWLKCTCDKWPESVDDDDLEEWKKWRAPRWLFNQPFANQPYDRAKAWERMDEAGTKHVLEVIEDMFNGLLMMELEKAVDEAHVHLATEPPVKVTHEPEQKTPIVPRSSAPQSQLDRREQKIWKVIQRGSKGLIYCRELDGENIAPKRTGVWSEGPRKYVAAYNQGEPWRHRIQDEKSKVQRKVKLAGLAGE